MQPITIVVTTIIFMMAILYLVGAFRFTKKERTVVPWPTKSGWYWVSNGDLVYDQIVWADAELKVWLVRHALQQVLKGPEPEFDGTKWALKFTRVLDNNPF